MIDVLVFLVVLLVYAAATPHFAVRRHLPQPATDEAAIQQAYEAGYPRRRALRLVAPVLLAYFLLRAALFGPDPGHISDLVVPYFFTFGIVYVLSLLAAVLWRYGWDRRFVAAHPEFADSLQPVGLRLLGPLLILVVFACVAVGVSLHDPIFGLPLELLGIVALFAGQRVLLAMVVRSRVPVPLDSPLGRAAADIVNRFGFEPKRVILVPSVVANAYALPDGSVMVTTALHHIASDEEIVGILAHELSHAKDRDVRRLTRARLLLFLVILGVTVGVAVGAQFLPAGNAVTVPVAVTAMISVGLLGVPRFARMSQSLEFKCDRAAMAAGRGPDLAEGLIKLHRFMGLPQRWLPGDARYLTHPSLDVRLSALRESGDYPRP